MRNERLALLLALVLGFALPASAQIVGLPQGITVVDSGTACVTAPTACAVYVLDTQTGGLAIGVVGTWTGTLTFEGTPDNNTWTSLLATNLATGAQATTTTANGLFTITNAGVIKIRVRATGAITGTATITAAKGLGFARTAFPGGLTVDGSGSLVTTGNITGFSLTASGGAVAVAATSFLQFTGRGLFRSPANGVITVNNNGETVGAELKVDALPTVGSGFGTSPAIIAGSTAFAGSVNVGTGGAATTGVVTFGGTAYPSAPFCTYSTQTTNATTRGLPTTTQLTLNSTTAWTASDIVSWVCVSSK